MESLSFRKMVKKVYQILIANLYYRPFKKNEYLFYKRYTICASCIDKKKAPIIGEYCDLCGCPLKSKLRVIDVKCEKNLW